MNFFYGSNTDNTVSPHGKIALARTITFMLVLFGTNSSPSHMFCGQYNTNLTPCSRITPKRSVSGPLMDRKPLSLAFIKKESHCHRCRQQCCKVHRRLSFFEADMIIVNNKKFIRTKLGDTIAVDWVSNLIHA